MVEFLRMKATLILMALLVAGVRADEDEIESSQQELADFCGGVLGKSAVITGRNTAVTSDGEFVSYNGRGFATSNGYYGKNGSQVFGNGKLVVRSGNLFYGSSSSWKNGNSYYDGDKSSWITKSNELDD